MPGELFDGPGVDPLPVVGTGTGTTTGPAAEFCGPGCGVCGVFGVAPPAVGSAGTRWLGTGDGEVGWDVDGEPVDGVPVDGPAVAGPPETLPAAPA
jgi:hypothetical protein